MSPTYDLFLLLHPFRDNVREFLTRLHALTDLQKRYLRGAEGYYCGERDTALLVLRFPERARQTRGANLRRLVADLTHLPVVVPSELSPRLRRRFFVDHVARHDTYIQHYAYLGQDSPVAVRVVESLAQHAHGESPFAGPYFDLEYDRPQFGSSHEWLDSCGEPTPG